MGKKLGLILAAGLLVAGCGVSPPQVKDTGNVGVIESTSPTYSTPAYSVPITTPVTTAAPTTSEVPVATAVPAAPQTTAPKSVAPKVAAPKTTAAKAQAPKTTAKPAPQPAACGADYYRNVDGNCVHRPGNNPAGATAICKDGSYSYSQNHSGTCSGHGGVRTWL
ncbi:DUF3761 domain-containing protein [Amycolatopsis sp., V23-08]|uniref:DUF3761 domain-containing protein n=1 Tax=Amycolatopsis heterodermiae TaxID=3110235 RepID=A0ABU5QWW3_9PSEU|nr:DUF3761 domain-containing protein [Amycolatopsis sp., V23-08]MEA5358353.1 DUF3761 domain-containing protein [Amycolatopsis sp., V23-08]